MSKELLRCPYCGGEASFIHRWDMYWVECMKCHAQSTPDINEELATKDWNRRYVGIKDKKFTPIHTGDIIAFFDVRGEVVFFRGSYGMQTKEFIDDELLMIQLPPMENDHFHRVDYFVSLWEIWRKYPHVESILSCVKVIGNKWDNPELLEEIK